MKERIDFVEQSEYNSRNVFNTNDKIVQVQMSEQIFNKLEERNFSKIGIKLIKCPVKNPEFKTKRFYRFVDKFKNYMIEKLRICSSLDTKDTVCNAAIQMVLTKLSYDIAEVDEEVKEVLDKNYGTHPYDIFQIISNNNVLSKLVNRKSFVDEAKKYIMNFLYDVVYPSEFLSLSEQKLEDCIIDYLSSCYISMDDDEKFMLSYTNLLPGALDLNVFLQDYLDRLYNDILLTITMYDRQNIDKQIEDYNKDFQNKINEANKTIESLQKEIDEEHIKAKEFLPTLKRLKKEAEEGTKNQQNIFDACIVDKNREIRQLEKQIQHLTDKLNTIQPEDEELQDIIEEINYTFDDTLKYSFITYGNLDFEKQIKEAIPNAIIVNSSKDFNNVTDLVIFMTKHVKHNMYYKIKDICKTRNIPYMHCAISNVDYIKDEIAKYLSRNYGTQ